MTTEEKGDLYTQLQEQGRLLENRKAKIKSENVLSMTPEAKKEMTEVQNRINDVMNRMTILVNNG